jgi:hypothetical protein
MWETHSGKLALLGGISSIVFDQFGNLYAGYQDVAGSANVLISKVIIER